MIARLAVALVLVTGVAGAARAQDLPGAPELIADIRVHGNHTTPDADILALSGLTRGDEASEVRLRQAEKRLRDTGRFERVELRRRFMSIADPTQILVMVLVDEHPAVSASDLTPGALKKLRTASMFLPILKHADGYGFTFGMRVAFPDAIGPRSRISVPLTWGGERRLGLEAERSFDGPISLLRGSIALQRRVNPHYEVPDFRQEARVEAERLVTDWLRAGASARIAQVDFGPAYEAAHSAAGVHVTVDTRVDPSFPRNAVQIRAGWEHLFFGAPATVTGPGISDGLRSASGSDATRWNTDARGYIGLGGSLVLALRGYLVRSSDPLPFAEQSLLGGSDTVRGYRTGHRAGDSLAAVSAEVRVPINSPLSVGRFGVKGFVDAGTTWSAGARLSDQRFDRGIGGGVYAGGGPLLMDLDVAWPEEGKPRVHFGLGVSF